MGRSLVLLWLGAASARTEHEADLRSWAEARHVALADPVSAPVHRTAYPARRVTDIESWIAEARAAVDALDDAGAQTKLEAAEALLREEPPPQAAWLMAEVYRLRAEHLSRHAPEQAAAWLQRASALSGPRARGYREASVPETDDAVRPTPRVPLVGVGERDTLYVDGVRTDARDVAEGEHHLFIVRRGEAVYSAWIDAALPSLEVATRRPPPCSDADLHEVRIAPSGRVVVPADVACPSWAVARPARGGVEVARCHLAACGTLLPWAHTDGSLFEEPAQPPPRDAPGVPVWLSWTLAGLATATAASLVLWQTGVFDDPEPGRTRFVFTPPERPAAR